MGGPGSNVHLFEIGLASTPGCLCGHKQESISHFLMDYHNERELLLLNILMLNKFIYNYANNIEPTHPTIFSFCLGPCRKC